ncbi:Ran GTPase-activating protein 1 [Hypsizygus marmoreus]|uniref:Ran GTPase-activating protein 1 n=1 Tax=Hypsizygus marmoreus TaxID=39966 RepID=A0A369JBG2_HYPMA|nr:Ran GTPase-activating protein 1 [Hypsizygus marmoreus]
MATSSKVLSLSGKGLKLDTRADIEPWLAPFDPAVVEEIHLGGNTLGVEAATALGEFLEKTEVLKIADFADIFTGRLISEIPLALSAICDALKDKTSLIELNLSDNAFGGRSVDPIVPFLTYNRSFQVLKINNNGLGPAGGVVLANALLESARLSKAEGKRSNLRTIICGRNRLEDGSAHVWAEAFAAHETLVDVRMPQNGIRMQGIAALARGLAKCADLEHIDLQDNTFTEDGAVLALEAWTDALRSWPELRILNLSDCVLSSEGEVPILVSALATGINAKLHTLALQNNNLETRTFSLLAEGISSSLGSLMALELQYNDQEDDDEHIETLALSLKQRGGKLFATDEDEEEEEREAEQREAEAEEEKAKEQAQVEGVKVEEKKPTLADKDADALADLLSKVEIH